MVQGSANVSDFGETQISVLRRAGEAGGGGFRDSESENKTMLNYQPPAYINLAADSVRVSRDPYGALPLPVNSLPSYRFFGEKSDFRSHDRSWPVW